MATERRRQQVLLGALVVVLVVVIYRLWPAPSAAPAAASNSQGARGGAAAGARTPGLAAPDVHLEALETKRTQPGPVRRDLFRFKPKAAPPSSPAPQIGGPAAPVTTPPPTATPAAPQVPPITLKFIGVMESQAQKIAVLSDGRGAPFYGKEGEVVEGRYRILKIGVESIDIAYADGRGRQTIRLSGQ